MYANKIVIVGLGVTGISCLRYFNRQGEAVVLVDTRENPPGLTELRTEFPNLAIALGEFTAAQFAQAKLLVVSPGISLQSPAIKQAQAQGIPIIGDIELFAKTAKAPIIGITGTNAKGTVTTLISEMIKAAGYKVLVGGNIGTAVLDLLIEPTPDYYVLELSSFQLETTYSLALKVATILNISEDHLDRHETMENYIAAKQRIYQRCEIAVYNRNDLATVPKNSVSHKINFGLSKPMTKELGLLPINHETYLAIGEKILLNINELKIKGRHNWENALAALAVGHAIQLPLKAMQQALINFKGLPHRCEWILEHAGVIWFDDSKGTNVGSTLAAIQGLGSTIKGKLILIAGGLGKGADFSPLYEPVKKYVSQVILLGQDAPILAKALQDAAIIHNVKTLKDAVNTANQLAQPGDAVLLSPACASWDMFRNYAERGDIFKAAVRALYQSR